MSQYRLSSWAIAVGIGLMFVGRASADTLGDWAHRAVSDDEHTAQEAIDQLRAKGPDGLEAMFAAHRDLIDRATRGTLCGRTADQWQRLRHAIDQVGAQRDCYTSRLYWYTDLESAKQAAADAGRPILSLRLLGKLTDEYSCANSRFFRTVLYANREVADALGERFVLHWQSERPVPRVSIDFGDGRVIQRTLTGNSIHYVLDQQGRPVDALPGLYGPRAFLNGLTHAEPIALAYAAVDADAWRQGVRDYHAVRLTQLVDTWQQDLNHLQIPVNDPSADVSEDSAVVVEGQPVPARAAALRAVSKSAVEVPILDQLAFFDVAGRSRRLASSMDEQAWQRLAHLYAEEARLDEGSIALMWRQNGHAFGSHSAKQSANSMTPMIRNFQRAIALDTVRNEFLLHREIHGRYIDNLVPAELEALNRWVYAELFLTPSSDPWLGLAPDDTYTALESTTATR